MAISRNRSMDALVPAEQLWLNVGYHKSNGEFIRVPLGIFLRTPEELKAQGVRWMTEDQEALLKMLTDQAVALETGSSCEVADFKGAGLVIELRKHSPV